MSKKLELSTAYYIAKGRSLQAILDWQEGVRAFAKEALACVDTEPKPRAALHYEYSRCFGYVFDTEPDRTVWRRLPKHANGWAPRRNTKTGKALAAKMAAVPPAPNLLKSLGLPGIMDVMRGNRWYTSGVEMISDKWVISVPFGNEPDSKQPAPHDAERVSMAYVASLMEVAAQAALQDS